MAAEETPRTPRHRTTPVVLGSLGALAEDGRQQLPGLARIAAAASLRSAAWAAEATGRNGRLALRALTDPGATADLLEEVARDVAEAAGTVQEVARAIGSGTPITEALLDGGNQVAADVGARLGLNKEPPGPAEPAEPTPIELEETDLRARGARLLERSRDVWNEEPVHPAFSRILDDLAPDEARILLLLARGGPQPSVDVRTGGPVGVVSSSLIASGLSMIGARSGCRYLEEVPAYLNNLFRLGLIWFSREPVEDPMEYQVVEAQPDVLAAMHSLRFTKVVRRSIHLTPFGEQFCRAVLIDPEATGPLPEHQSPED